MPAASCIGRLKFPASECWLRNPTDQDEILNDLLDKYRTANSPIFVRGESIRPVENGFPKVLRQLQVPDERNALCAFMLPSAVVEMKIPEIIARLCPPHLDGGIETMVNITPRGSAVDLHFGTFKLLTLGL